MKQVTQWHGDGKQSTGWSTPIAPVSTTWASNDSRTPATVRVSTPNDTAWNHTSQSPQGYMYNDPTIPYNSPLFTYNYIVNNNTSNQLLQTRWAAV